MTSLVADEILTRARNAQKTWSAMKVSHRERFLRALRGEIAASSETIASAVATESSKPLLDALAGDVLVTLEHLRFYERHAARILRPQRVARSWLFFRGARFETHLEAHGVVLIFGASNYPFQLSVIPMATALAAGNAVVLKCSERTPATAAMIGQLCERAGLPRDLVQVLCVDPAASATLIDGRPDFIFFTGSSTNGGEVAERAAKLHIPCALELGGKDAAIVFADCHLDRTIEGITYGAFSNSGRVCVGVKRLYVQSNIYDRFLKRLLDRIQALNVSPDPHTDLRSDPKGISPLLRDQVGNALSHGANVEYPTKLDEINSGPVVLSQVPGEARILAEESFGPVLCVAPFRDEEEAIKLANASEFALSSSIWTSNPACARRVAAQLSAGSCAVNDVIRVIANPYAPFGGNRSSGHGRYHGAEGLRTFSRVKTIMIAKDRAKREISWFPFTAKTTRQLLVLIRLRHGGLRSLARVGVLLSVALAVLAPLAQAAQRKPESHLSIVVHLTPGARGELGYLIFASPAGFPGDRDKAMRSGFIPISSGTRDLEIKADLPAGNYAVSVYEDLNSNHKLDHNLIGIPREPVGVSNNPAPRYGPPRFNECSFKLNSPAQTISITVVPRI